VAPESIIPYTTRTEPNLTVIIDGTFVATDSERQAIASFVTNENEKKLILNSIFKLRFIKTIVKSGKKLQVNNPGIQIDANGLSKYTTLVQRALNYLLPKLQTNSILQIIDSNLFSPQERLRPLQELIQMLPHNSALVNQFVRNKLYKAKQDNDEDYTILKQKIIDSYPEMVDFDMDFDINSAQIQLYFKNENSDIRMPLEGEGLGIQEFFYLFLILHYFPETIILDDEAFVHMHKSLLSDFLTAINDVDYQMITTSHIKELIQSLDFGNVICCEKHNGIATVKNLLKSSDIDEVLKDLGYDIHEDEDMNEYLRSGE
jgi:hypothetical protein